jgi:hypothetical protein
MNKDDSIRAAVAKMQTDSRVVAALSDPFAPTTPEDMQRLAHSHKKLWRIYEAALARIEHLEIQLTHFADLRWRN